jgi:phosphate-selective porin OprO/OprP
VAYDVLQGFELGFNKGGLRINGEFILNQTVMDKNAFTAQEIAAGKAKTKNFYGWFAQASYLLFGGQQRYDYGDSEFTRPTRGRKWGDVEVMARYDYLTLNSEDIKGGSGENYTLGVVFHVNNNVKIMANYQYSQNDRWANYKGRATVGLNAAGQPTKDPRQVVSQPGLRFHALQTRIELTF